MRGRCFYNTTYCCCSTCTAHVSFMPDTNCHTVIGPRYGRRTGQVRLAVFLLRRPGLPGLPPSCAATIASASASERVRAPLLVIHRARDRQRDNARFLPWHLRHRITLRHQWLRLPSYFCSASKLLERARPDARPDSAARAACGCAESAGGRLASSAGGLVHHFTDNPIRDQAAFAMRDAAALPIGALTVKLASAE